MAHDWIKMRGALLDHPKIVRISRELQKNQKFREWLTPGGSGPINGQICSDAALRCVTTALLMRLWSASREHGNFVGDDLVLEHSDIDDLDQIAGAPGIGRAMNVVRWAIAKNGVTLPNFKEFNVPLTPAEKQKSYRQRHHKGNGAVTETLPSEGNENLQNVTSREEKRRNKKDIPAKKPAGAHLPKGRKKSDLHSLPADWAPSEATVKRLAIEFRLHIPEDVDRYLAAFKDACQAKDYHYKNFDAAFCNCVRQDWPKLRGGRPTMHEDNYPTKVAL
jgi:hypothetical protein